MKCVQKVHHMYMYTSICFSMIGPIKYRDYMYLSQTLCLEGHAGLIL